jgi:hypothetical protein
MIKLSPLNLIPNPYTFRRKKFRRSLEEEEERIDYILIINEINTNKLIALPPV